MARKSIQLGFLIAAFVISATAQSNVTTTTGGTAGVVPKFTTGTNVENSPISVSGSSVGISTKVTSPQICGQQSGNTWVIECQLPNGAPSCTYGASTSTTQAGCAFLGALNAWNASHQMQVIEGNGNQIFPTDVIWQIPTPNTYNGPLMHIDMHGSTLQYSGTSTPSCVIQKTDNTKGNLQIEPMKIDPNGLAGCGLYINNPGHDSYVRMVTALSGTNAGYNTYIAKITNQTEGDFSVSAIGPGAGGGTTLASATPTWSSGVLTGMTTRTNCDSATHSVPGAGSTACDGYYLQANTTGWNVLVSWGGPPNSSQGPCTVAPVVYANVSSSTNRVTGYTIVHGGSGCGTNATPVIQVTAQAQYGIVSLGSDSRLNWGVSQAAGSPYYDEWQMSSCTATSSNFTITYSAVNYGNAPQSGEQVTFPSLAGSTPCTQNYPSGIGNHTFFISSVGTGTFTVNTGFSADTQTESTYASSRDDGYGIWATGDEFGFLHPYYSPVGILMQRGHFVHIENDSNYLAGVRIAQASTNQGGGNIVVDSLTHYWNSSVLGATPVAPMGIQFWPGIYPPVAANVSIRNISCGYQFPSTFGNLVGSSAILDNVLPYTNIGGWSVESKSVQDCSKPISTPVFLTDSIKAGMFTPGNVTAGGGSNIVYRCTTAGTLPVGALTTATGNCGASTDSGLRLK